VATALIIWFRLKKTEWVKSSLAVVTCQEASPGAFSDSVKWSAMSGLPKDYSHVGLAVVHTLH